MYEYKYVDLLSEGVSASRFEEHRAIIDKYAAQGWRYVGYLPTKISMGGVLGNIDLIFERKAEERD